MINFFLNDNKNAIKKVTIMKYGKYNNNLG